ncbi:MAG: 1-deoxy-D-xylulose-5-phosphate reductoisomerase [Opitutae bacterium]|nr:1-deoxy-D-xylulose-5-phosphate reductoisomerase [Opitutae bacterium]MBT5716137.1 1-deoxy-D-xylulose-5-phosphate reductoisomerase [Opitutae bacterium]
MSQPKKLVLLGATGSIGDSTLKVIRKHPDKIQLVGISAHQQAEKLLGIAEEFKVPHACLTSEKSPKPSFPGYTKLQTGENSLEELASLQDADIIVVAVVGAVGLMPTLAALKAGKDVVLANKESLVMGGEIVTKTAEKYGAKIIPADSEHNAVFQCIQGQPEKSVESIILTASGGPFRDLPLNQLDKVTIEQALRHPNWSMGKKITVDSATMANKGLELIEARWLFHVDPKQLEVVIHPTSIVHAIVRFIDGCCLAEMTPPSMTFAMQNAILFPERHEGVEPSLDFSQPLDLSFSQPSLERYPCLRLAQKSMETGNSAPLVFNAANEIAVDAFLRNRIGFLDIPRIIENTLNESEFISTESIEALLSSDAESRRIAATQIDLLA